jgi:polysaccharide export outer membrane protein
MATTTPLRRTMLDRALSRQPRGGGGILPPGVSLAVSAAVCLCLQSVLSYALYAQETPSSPPLTQFTTTNGDAPISPGDLLAISVFDTPEFTGTMRVSNEGNLSLPLIGSVHVAGLTAPRAAQVIRDMLVNGNFLKDPQVSVAFVDFISQSAVVLGEVRVPGAIPVLGSRTLWQVIAAAGGVNPTAGQRVTIIHRKDPTHPEVVKINWGLDLANQPNPQVAPEDTVQVSRAGIAYVVGEVGRQGGYPFTNEGMTLAQVITLAEGVKYTSKASKARLIRKTASGRLIFEVNIPSLLQGKASDIALQNDDIIYVPNSVSKVVITRGIESAITVAGSLAIVSYR